MDLLTQIGDLLVQVVSNLTNPEAWKTALSNREAIVAAFITLNLIVFTETGLLFGFFLPGDSLLVTAGVVASLVDWPVHILIPTLCCAAILGDSSGYLIGKVMGPKLFRKEKSFFFRKDYLLMAKISTRSTAARRSCWRSSCRSSARSHRWWPGPVACPTAASSPSPCAARSRGSPA